MIMRTCCFFLIVYVWVLLFATVTISREGRIKLGRICVCVCYSRCLRAARYTEVLIVWRCRVARRAFWLCDDLLSSVHCSFQTERGVTESIETYSIYRGKKTTTIPRCRWFHFALHNTPPVNWRACTIMSFKALIFHCFSSSSEHVSPHTNAFLIASFSFYSFYQCNISLLPAINTSIHYRSFPLF